MNQALLHTREARSPKGFTLIELMVVLVVVAVLAGVALPSFMTQVRKSRRSDAITELYRVSQAQERHRANNTTYSGNLGTGGLGVTTAATAASYNMANGYYSISVADNAAATYTLTATTVTGSSMESDTACRRLIVTAASGTITYTSFPAVGAENGTAANNRCWNRG